MAVFCCVCAAGQQPGAAPASADASTPAADPPATPGAPARPGATAAAGSATSSQDLPIDKRILGVLPNYRTVQDNGHVEPITAKRKFWIASKDSFDWPIWLTAAGFAGYYQILNSNPEFGQGLKGYAKRYATSFADQSIGNLMTEGVMPSLLHEDPRYFRRGAGRVGYRLWYASTRIFVTHTDAGTTRFNFSEWVGNSTAVAFSNVYYTKTRDVEDNVDKLGLQVATDAISNVLKEFWPDVKHKFHHPKPEVALE